VPRAGLSSQDVVAAAAELADEVSYEKLTMGLVAQRLGIRTPSLTSTSTTWPTCGTASPPRP